MLHRPEQIEAKPPALGISRVDRAAAEHLRKKRMAHLPPRIRIAKHAAQIGHDRFVIRLAEIGERSASILRVGFREANPSPSRGVERSCLEGPGRVG